MENKYIKRETILNVLNRFFHERADNEAHVLIFKIKQALLELPLADVEEVTRCEHCNCSIECGSVLYCTYFNKNVEPNGYCSEG